MSNPIHIHTLTGPYNLTGARYYLYLDPTDRDVSDYTAIGNGIPSEAWHHRVILMNVNPRLHLPSLTDALKSDEAQALLEGIFDQWRGEDLSSNGTRVGQWDDEVNDLIDELEDVIAEVPTLTDADRVLDGCDVCFLLTLGSTFEEIAQDILTDALNNKVYLNPDDLSGALKTFLSSFTDEDGLTAEEMAQLKSLLEE